MLFIQVHPVGSSHREFAFQGRGETTNSLSSKHLRKCHLRTDHVLSQVALPSEFGCKPLPRMHLRPVGVNRSSCDPVRKVWLSRTVVALPSENPSTAPQSLVVRGIERTSVRRSSATHCNHIICASSILSPSRDSCSGSANPQVPATNQTAISPQQIPHFHPRRIRQELDRVSHFRPTKPSKSTTLRGLRADLHPSNESLAETGLSGDYRTAHFHPTSSHFNPSFSHLVLRNVALESDFSCHVHLQFVSCRHL